MHRALVAFVFLAGITRPKLFWGHIAVNPALHRNLAFFRDYQPSAGAERARLFISAGTLDDPRFREPALEWIDSSMVREDSHLYLEVAALIGEHDASAAPTAYRAGLRRLFAEQ